MKPIAITLGDPAGIGAEVVFKALGSMVERPPVRIFGSWALARETPGATSEHFSDVGGEDPLRHGVIAQQYGEVALRSIDAAVAAIEAGECSALVTAPIHKRAIALAGSLHPGHTEILAARAGLHTYGRDYAMYFESPRLRTVLLSVHEPLRDAIAHIDAQSIVDLAALTSRGYQKLHGTQPRIGVAGLNPHAGEEGLFGRDEEEIARGVAAAAQKGISITGPHAPDTVFLSAIRGRFDVVLALYHDQGLIPIKTLDFEQSVNVTLGLPYLRCSVDHGTAFDIAGTWTADAAPMSYAIRWATDHAERWGR